MTVIISNVLAVPTALISPEIYAKLLPLIIHEDPSWVIKRSRGFFADPKERYIYSYSMTADNEYYLFNRGLMNKVLDILRLNGLIFDIDDRRVLGEPLKILPHWGSTLFKFQERALADVIQGEDGLLVADCGSGKTVMGAALIAMLKQPTLVVVTSLSILKQWVDSIHAFTDYKKHKIGTIGGGKFKIAPITITTFQSLTKFDRDAWMEINEKFGCLMLDECFHPETKILLPNNKYLPIRKIVDDSSIDAVMSFDEERNRLVEKKIVRKIKTPIRGRAVYDITIRASNGVERVVTCTDNHKFWTSNRGFVQAKDLTNADALKLLIDDTLRLKTRVFSHTATVINVRRRKHSPKFVYNLEIEDTHNYFANGALVSNCHHSPCASMMAITNKSKAKYRFGFTATPTRKDKKEFVMFDCLGHRTITIGSDELAAEGRRVIPSVEFVSLRTRLAMPKMLRWNGSKRIEDNNWSKFFTEMAECQPRNEMIVDKVVETVTAKHKCLVLSNRVEHCNVLYHMLSLKGLKCGLMLGTMNGEDRADILKRAKRGDFDVLVATKNLAAEGLDVPILSCVHLVSPTSNTPYLQQAIGRVCRATPNKMALAIDYVDVDCDVLFGMHFARSRFYKAEGYAVLNELKKNQS